MRFFFAPIILLIYTLLTFGLTYPLPFNLTTHVPNDIGDPLLNSWIIAWDIHALLTDPVNLFNANIFYPLPNTLAFSEHLLSTAALIAPLHLLWTEPILSYNLSLLLTFPLAAFGMYLLLWQWTGQRWAAFLGGLIFGFAPYRFAAIAHLQLLTVQWLPFIILFLERHLRYPTHKTGRYQLALTVLLTAQLLTSWYLAIYTLLIVALFLLPMVWIQRHDYRWRIVLTTRFLFITALLLLPIAWPYFNLLTELRHSRPLHVAISLAAHPLDYLAAAPFNTLFGSLTAPFRQRIGFTEENTLFIGLIAPLLILFSATTKGQAVRLFSLIALLCITLSLTFALPYTLLATILPPSTVIRVPPRWLIPALFAIAALAGIGFSQVRRLPYILTMILILESASIPLPLAKVDNQTTLNPAYQWLAEQPEPFALLELPLHHDPEYPEVKRMVASARGWWSLVNGYSGYTPPRQKELAQQVALFPAAESVVSLQQLALELPVPLYLLVHPAEAPFDRSQWETKQRWQAEHQPALKPLGIFAGDYLYELQPAPMTMEPLVTFGESMSLLGYAHQPTPEGEVLRLYWQITKPLTAEYTIFIHLRAADGFVRAQADGLPVQGHYPLSQWQQGEVVQDIRLLPAVAYDHLAIGWYDSVTGARLPAVDSAGQPLPDDMWLLKPESP